MLAIKNLEGEIFLLTGASDIVRKRRVNGEKELSLKLHKTKQNASFFGDIEKLWRIIDFNGEEYPILLYRDVAVGNSYTRDLSCLHSFFDDMRNHVVYQSFSSSKTFDAMMQFIFNGSGYSYNIIGQFYAQDFENFGDDYGLELFKTALERYGAEFTLDGMVVNLRTRIGNTTDFQYRHKFNLESIEREVDALDFSTYGEGFGKDGLHVFYRSPLADIYGERPIKAVRDERFTIAENLTAHVKEIVDSSLKITLTVKLSDLRASGYNKNHPDEGDTLILVDDRLDLKIDTRIVEISEKFDNKGKVLDCDVTLSNFSNIFEQQRRIHNATKTLADAISGKRPLPFEALAVAVQQATIALQNAQTELVFPANGGIMAVDKNDPNKIVVFNSAGLGVSEDGGQTFKTAVTGSGFVADLITVGTMLADRIKGGTLTLGGDVNGRMIVLNDNGETIADLDANSGGFQELYVGYLHSPSIINVNTENRNYNVNTNGGISSILDNIPRINNATVTFTLTSNITDDVEISNFLGNGTLRINLNGFKLNGSIAVVGVGAQFVEIMSGTVNSRHPDYCIRVDRSTYVRIQGVKTYGNNIANRGIWVHAGSAAFLDGCEAYNVNAGFAASTSAQITIMNGKGSASQYGVHAFWGGIIYVDGTIPSGATRDVQEATGEVLGYTTSSGGETTPPPPPPETTKTWYANDANNWSTSGYWSNDDVKQGNYGYGTRTGYWFFPNDISSTLTGKTIKSMRCYVKRKSAGGSSGSVPIRIHWHTYADKPSGQPNDLDLSGSEEAVKNLAWGEEGWVTLPSSFYNNFESGEAKGLGVYAGSSRSEYAVLQSYCRLEVTYE
ncbi:MAG: phage tail spike protein [Bacillota bacterium]